MFINNIIPDQSLAGYVRLYRIMDFNFAIDTPLPCKAYHPRVEHCLQFIPRDNEKIVYDNRSPIYAPTKVAIVGQHTVTNHRYVGRNFLNVQVVFQPFALYRLTGIPSLESTNLYCDARSLLGSEAELVNEQLSEISDYRQMIVVVEMYLKKLVRKVKKENHRIDTISRLMLNGNTAHTIDWYSHESCLSHRQFDRLFFQRIGIGPKEFMNLVRLDKAYIYRNRFPEKDWLTVALETGYYDYQHLARVYQMFTGLSPVQFFALEQKAPERQFGHYEQ